MASKKRTDPKRNSNRFVNPCNDWPFGVIGGPIRFVKWVSSMALASHSRPNLECDLPIMEPYFLNTKFDSNYKYKTKETRGGAHNISENTVTLNPLDQNNASVNMDCDHQEKEGLTTNQCEDMEGHLIDITTTVDDPKKIEDQTHNASVNLDGNNGRMGGFFTNQSEQDKKEPVIKAPTNAAYFNQEEDQTIQGKSLIQNGIRATWLGHASVLVEIDGFRLLCDPVFSGRCPPIVGPHRFRDAPCEVKELPAIDAVLISHNHYDHMDSDTIRRLDAEQPCITWLVPMGDKQTVQGMIDPKRYHNVIEMSWWQKHPLKSTRCTNGMDIYYTPSQHWSNRGLLDSFKSLWGSWTMIGPKHRFWFGGDTGYCELFKEIGDNFGPFDGAAIPIGAYKPRSLTQFQHVNPEEAVMIHNDIKSKISFGIHWGTFQLTSESYMEPKEELEKYAKISNVNFITMNHGETLEIIGDINGILEVPQKNVERKPSATLYGQRSYATRAVKKIWPFSSLCGRYDSETRF